MITNSKRRPFAALCLLAAPAWWPARTSAQNLSINNADLPPGFLGQNYDVQVTASGGRAPYSWSWQGTTPPGLTLSAELGEITGVPQKVGAYTFQVWVRDALSATTFRELTINVYESLTITTPTTLPRGTVGKNYSTTLAAAGGVPPYSWLFYSAPVPPGLTLSRGNGVLSGYPTSAGNWVFRVQVQDSIGGFFDKRFEVAFDAGPLGISSGPGLPLAVAGETYSTDLSASGGVPPYAWSIAQGALPAGLTLSAAGNIGGRPTGAGNYSFTVRVRDSGGQEATKPLTLAVSAGLEITTGCPLPPATVQTAYSTTLAAGGGSAPYTWSLASGALAPGLALSASGGITGAPTTAQTASFALRVKDGRNREATKTCSLTVQLLLQPAALAAPVLGVAYRQVLNAVGGPGPFQWSVTQGQLPPGLALNTSSGELAGTPSSAGSFSFGVRATDNGTRATGDRSYSLAVGVAAVPSITIGGLTDPVAAATQPRIGVTLGSGYPAELTGRLTVRFTSSATNLADDPAIQFQPQGRTVDFRIPANSTRALFGTASDVGLQTGTVAGTISVSATLAVGGRDVTPAPAPARTARVNPAAPTISTVSATRGAGSVTVAITGYSTTRRIDDATFTFSVGATYQLQTASYTVTTSATSDGWFRSSESTTKNGGLFYYEQAFTVDRPEGVTSITVVLRNAAGNSQSRTYTF